MGALQEFKAFAVKGNVVDMAVGVIIGAAFGKIVSSLVGDVIMPPIGVVLGGVDFSNLSIVVKEAGSKPAVLISYGKFLQTIIDFTIIAFAVFAMVKALNTLKKKQEPVAAPPTLELTRQELLLTEIRDLLSQKR